MKVIKTKPVMEVSKEEMKAIKLFCREIVEIYEGSGYDFSLDDMLSDIGSDLIENSYFSFKIV